MSGRTKKEEGSRKNEEGSSATDSLDGCQEVERRKKEKGVSAIKNVLTVGRGCYINQILIEITPIHLMSWCGLRTLRKLSGADFTPYKNCFSLLSSFGFLTSVTSVTSVERIRCRTSFFLLLYYWCFRYSKTLLSPISCGIG